MRKLLTSSNKTQATIADRARQVDLEEPLPLLRTYWLIQANLIKALWLGNRFSRHEEVLKWNEVTQ